MINNSKQLKNKEILLEKFFPQKELRSKAKLELLGFLFNNGYFFRRNLFSKNDFFIPVYFKKNLFINIKKYGGVFIVFKFKNSKDKNSYLQDCIKIKMFSYKKN